MNNLGRNIKHLRKQQKYSQIELASIIGVSQTSVAHYEAGIDSNIEKLIVSTYKFLLKMNDLHQVQRKMISFLKNLSNIYPQDLKKEFINLHSELIKFENHPYEKRSFLYLDILSWLESKIQNETVESIIQKKAKKALK